MLRKLLVLSSWLLATKKQLNTQRGAIAPILVVLLLLGGLGVGVFLINKPTNLTPKASGGSVVFISEDLKTQITQTSSPKVKIKLTAPWSPPEGHYDGDNGTFLIIPPVHAGKKYLDQDDDAESKRSEKTPKPIKNAGQDDDNNPDKEDKDKQDKERNPDQDETGGTKSPKPKQDKSKDVKLFAEEVVLAEDPNFTQNVVTSSYTNNRTITVDYEFSKSLSGVVDPGIKSIYVKFRATDNTTEQNALPFPATIKYDPNLQSGSGEKPESSKNPGQKDKEGSGAILRLLKNENYKGSKCHLSLNVELDTGGKQTDGTDAIIKYDPNRLWGNYIDNGSIYPDYPATSIDNQTGIILISGLSSVDQAFSGTGILATIDFSFKSKTSLGRTIINFDFDPNNTQKTTDSNVVERGTNIDILGSVNNYSYVISKSNSSCGPNE